MTTDAGTYSSKLTGSIGYSFCAEGDGEHACPFYLGSLDARASSDIAATMRCADGTTARHTIRNVVTRLAQPAFGIAARGSSKVGFPTGALVIESTLDIGDSHHARRRPNDADVVIEAERASFDATGLTATLTVPCNASHAIVKVHYTLADARTETPLDAPPSVKIDVDERVSCGIETELAAGIEDPDEDVDTVRWYVDDVMLAPSVSTLTFTKPHELRVVARDQRGGTTTATKVVECL